MRYTITLEFTVRGVGNHDDALEVGASMADHMLDTFNDNQSLHHLVGVSAKPAHGLSDGKKVTYAGK